MAMKSTYANRKILQGHCESAAYSKRASRRSTRGMMTPARESVARVWRICGNRSGDTRRQKVRGEKPTRYLSPHLHAIGKPHTSYDVGGFSVATITFAAWYFLSLNLECQVTAPLSTRMLAGGSCHRFPLKSAVLGHDGAASLVARERPGISRRPAPRIVANGCLL